MGSTSFTQLIVWQRACEVRQLVFDASEQFPVHQGYRLTAQMQTPALSIPANIAEGFGRRQPRDKATFYIIAKASAEELSDYVMFAKSRGYWSDVARVSRKLEEVGRMLRSLVRKTYGMRGS